MSTEPQSNFNLNRLSDTSDPSFLQCVRVAYLNISTNQLLEYFRILTSHFSHRLHTRTGNEILAGIAAVMSIDRAGEIFEENKIINKLPFHQKQYAEQLLDLLFFVANKAPGAFTDQIASQFADLCPENPRKCLTILAFYAQQFEKVANPMPMLDVLFHKSSCFRKIECAEDYISLLIWLLRNYPRFRDERLQHCWTYLCDMLTVTTASIICNIYNGLCAVFEIDPEKIKTYGYPSEAIACHIQHRSTQQATISFLLRYLPLPTAKYIDQILISLAEIAQNDEKATLLLLELATDESNSEILLTHPFWMSKVLPTTLDTLLLFGVIIIHEDLREIIVNTPETVNFFINLLQVNSIGVCNAVCTIMKHLPLTQDFVSSLSSSGFLAGYFGVSLEMNDPSVRLSALRLLDTLSRVKFVTEFIDMIPLVVDLIKENGELSLPASAVSARLARYPKCAKEFKARKLDEYFMQPIHDPRIKKYGDKFLTILSHIDSL